MQSPVFNRHKKPKLMGSNRRTCKKNLIFRLKLIWYTLVYALLNQCPFQNMHPGLVFISSSVFPSDKHFIQTQWFLSTSLGYQLKESPVSIYPLKNLNLPSTCSKKQNIKCNKVLELKDKIKRDSLQTSFKISFLFTQSQWQRKSHPTEFHIIRNGWVNFF